MYSGICDYRRCKWTHSQNMYAWSNRAWCHLCIILELNGTNIYQECIALLRNALSFLDYYMYYTIVIYFVLLIQFPQIFIYNRASVFSSAWQLRDIRPGHTTRLNLSVELGWVGGQSYSVETVFLGYIDCSQKTFHEHSIWIVSCDDLFPIWNVSMFIDQ